MDKTTNWVKESVCSASFWVMVLVVGLDGCRSDPFRVVYSNDDAVLTRALDKNAKLISYRTHDGWSALHAACCSGKLTNVRLILEHGADPSVRDCAGRSALQFAAMENNEDIINLLVCYGADVNAKDALGFTALHYSVFCGDDARAAHALLARGASPNAALPNDGVTPLHMAAEYGYEGVLKELIDSGADINVQNANGQTPLWLAVGSELTKIVQTLLDAGAKTDIKDSFYEQTPLERALEEKNDAIIALLEAKRGK